MYHVELSADAERDLAQLDRQVAQRLFKRIEWLEANSNRDLVVEQ